MHVTSVVFLSSAKMQINSAKETQCRFCRGYSSEETNSKKDQRKIWGNKFQGPHPKEQITLDVSKRPFEAHIGSLKMDLSELSADWDSDAFPDDQLFEIRSKIEIKNNTPVICYYFFPISK